MLSCTVLVEAQKSGIVVTYDLYSYGGHKSEQILRLLAGKSHFSLRKKDEELYNADGMVFYHSSIHQDIYTDFSQDKMVYCKLYQGITPVISTWPLQKFDWKVSSETKELLGYRVQKATTKAYYFEYADDSQGEIIAWFALDLPFSGGPEGYYGLPGLILEMKYSEKADHYVAKSVDTQANLHTISTPSEGFPVSKEQMIFPRFYPIDKKKVQDYNKKWLKEQQEKNQKKQHRK